jgi:hypothetical protein
MSCDCDMHRPWETAKIQKWNESESPNKHLFWLFFVAPERERGAAGLLILNHG